MDWEVAIKVFQNMKNFVDTIKLNQKTAEKRMLSQAVEDILKLYVSMSKGTVPEVVQNNRGNLFDTLWRWSEGQSFFPTTGKRMFGNY